MSRLLGQKISNDLSYDVADVFRFQFVLSPVELDIAEFKFIKVGERNLYYSGLLHTCELQDQTGAPIGVLLGQAVGAAGEHLKGLVQIDMPKAATPAVKAFQSFVASLAGRFVAILNLPGRHKKTHVYIDTASSFSTVYDSQSGIVASSLLLCLNRDIHPSEHYRISGALAQFANLAPYIPEQDPALADTGFFFGQTPDKYVMRIMPNHYLDLATLKTARYWPVENIEHDLDHAQAAEILVQRLGQIMGGISENLDGYFSISGGRDSRILLACMQNAKRSKLKMHCYATNWMTTLDVKVAQVMADSVGNELIVQIPQDNPKGSYFPRKRRSLFIAQRFSISSGFSGVCDDWWRRGYAKNLDADVNWIRGNFLEILTARFWPKRKFDIDKHVFHLLGRIGASTDNKDHLKHNLSFVEDWFGSFRNSIAENIHDFSYQELALGASQPFFHGVNQQFYIGPASDRLVFQTAMRVAPDQRMNSALYDEMLKISDAKLLDLPLAKNAVFRAKKSNTNAEVLLESELAAYAQKHLGQDA